MNHLFDFPAKKWNLGLAVLHDFGGCAMKAYARYVVSLVMLCVYILFKSKKKVF